MEFASAIHHQAHDFWFHRDFHHGFKAWSIENRNHYMFRQRNHDPTVFIPSFLLTCCIFSIPTAVSLFTFSLIIGQLSGECLETIRKSISKRLQKDTAAQLDLSIFISEICGFLNGSIISIYQETTDEDTEYFAKPIGFCYSLG